MDREFIEEKIIELTKEMDLKESFMKYAKDQEVRLSLRNEIYILSLQRDIYLKFYDFNKETEPIEEKEEENE